MTAGDDKATEYLEMLRLLGDGDFHSGEGLAERLGVSRTAIWKRLKGLEDWSGLKLEAKKGLGYRLPAPLEILAAEKILVGLNARQRATLAALHLLAEVDSTNDYLRRAGLAPEEQARACLAERQWAGKGRRGRRWQGQFGANLTLSVARRFELGLSELSGLSLAVGAGMVEMLSELGFTGIGLKWPNDLQHDRKKLAGILIEADGEAQGPVVATIGVGLNLRLSDAIGRQIDQPWTDLWRIGGQQLSRNDLAGRLLACLLAVCDRYADQGLAPFLPAWRRFDAFQGLSVRVMRGDQRIEGDYLGIDQSGGMRLSCDGEVRVLHAGEVSLRPAVDGN